MAKGRAERVSEVLAVLWYLVWIAGMVRVTLDVDTWLFRIIAAGTVVFIAYRFVKFLGAIRTTDAQTRRASMTTRDRRLFIAVGATWALGIACLGFGLWGLANPAPEWMPYPVYVAPIGGVVAGTIFLGFAARELARRIRRGPEPEGRHTKKPR